MKKIVMSVSLVCVVLLVASEKKKKIDITSLDQLRTETRHAKQDFNRTRGSDFVEKLDQKRNKMHSEHTTAGDTK